MTGLSLGQVMVIDRAMVGMVLILVRVRFPSFISSQYYSLYSGGVRT